jgi:hypothetical protein
MSRKVDSEWNLRPVWSTGALTEYLPAAVGDSNALPNEHTPKHGEQSWYIAYGNCVPCFASGCQGRPAGQLKPGPVTLVQIGRPHVHRRRDALLLQLARATAHGQAGACTCGLASVPNIAVFGQIMRVQINADVHARSARKMCTDLALDTQASDLRGHV